MKVTFVDAVKDGKLQSDNIKHILTLFKNGFITITIEEGKL